MKSYRQFSEEAIQEGAAAAGVVAGLTDWATKQIGKLVGGVGKQAKKRLVGKDHSRGHSESQELTGPKPGP